MDVRIPPDELNPRPPITVLLAEDEVLLRMVIADDISALGWVVVEASSADEAIALLFSGLEFDLLLTDVHMPGKNDGLDLARLVRTERPAVRIAVMSGILKPEAGHADLYDIFLPKPVSDVIEPLKELAGTCVEMQPSRSLVVRR